MFTGCEMGSSRFETGKVAETGRNTGKVSRKYIKAFSSYSVKTKRDGQTDGWTGGVAIMNMSRPRAYGAAGDNNR